MSRKREKREQRWRGIAVSDGLAAGRVLRVHTGARQSIYRVRLEDGEVEREVRRYRAAVRLSRRQLLFSTAASALAAPGRKPNILLILADDIGYGDMSCYGNSYIRTPHLDKLAAGGIRFTDFHASGPVCSPTRAGLVTGRYQQRCGITEVITAAGSRDNGSARYCSRSCPGARRSLGPSTLRTSS